MPPARIGIVKPSAMKFRRRASVKREVGEASGALRDELRSLSYRID
jgi:hypothetical protein